MNESSPYRQYYDEFYRQGDFRHYPEPVNRALLTVLARRCFPRDGSILDLGCGTGVHMRILTDLGWNVTGLDISRVALSQARRRSASSGLIEGDALRLPFRDGMFDGVMSFGCSLMSGLVPAAFHGFLLEGLRVLRDKSCLLAVTRSDFSGAVRSGWKHAGWDEYRSLLSGLPARSELIATHPRLFPFLGRYALAPPVTRCLRFSPIRVSAMVLLLLSKEEPPEGVSRFYSDE